MVARSMAEAYREPSSRASSPGASPPRPRNRWSQAAAIPSSTTFPGVSAQLEVPAGIGGSDLALWPEAKDLLIFLPPHEAIVVCELDGEELRLYDVVAPRPPPCAAMVGAVEALTGVAVDRLAIYFTPDLLDISPAPAAHPFDDLLMVRGEPLLDPSAPPFALSPFTKT